MKVVWFIVFVLCVICVVYNIERLCEVANAQESVLNQLLIGDTIKSQQDSATLWLVVTLIGGVISFLAFIFTSSSEKE